MEDFSQIFGGFWDFWRIFLVNLEDSEALSTSLFVVLLSFFSFRQYRRHILTRRYQSSHACF